MTPVFVVLLIFLGIGLFARTYNVWTRLLLIATIVGMLLFLYLTK